jgi:hypothetical protein
MSNVDAFLKVHQYNQPGEFLEPGEVFCTVRFHNLELNKENLELVLSESTDLEKLILQPHQIFQMILSLVKEYY